MNEDRNPENPDPSDTPVLLRDVTLRCRHCGYAGPAEPLAPGRAVVEALLWIAFLIPGVLYSLWRLFGRRYLCPRCKTAATEVRVPAGRRTAMVLRGVLLVLFVAALAGLLLLWSYPARP
ncbi:MAG: hypothetical protein ACYDA8_23850 [Deferrisomatales bacterium]